jgi:hypothetical protein
VTRAVAVAILLAAFPATAGSSPRVRVQSAEYTTEPALAEPELRVLRAKRGELRVRIIGEGRYCAAGWSAVVAANGDGVTLIADDSVDAPALLSTCALTLRITGLSRGTHSITLDTVTIRARVR